MKGFLDIINQGFANPAATEYLKALNPYMGNIATQAALQNREQQKFQQDTQKFELEKQEKLRKMKLAEMMPQILKELDPNDAKGSWDKLIQAGVEPQYAAPIISQLTGIGRAEKELAQDYELRKEGLGIQRGQLGVAQGHLGVARGELGLRAQEHALKIQELQQKLSGELSPEDQFKTEQELRKELSGLGQTKDFHTVKDAYEKVKEIAKDPSPANDIALIYSVMKIYDPGSVVRETEFANAQNAAGVPEKIRIQWNKLVNGESLTPEVRKDFLRSAKTVYKGQAKAYKPTASKFENLAKQYKVNPENVIIEAPEDILEAPIPNQTAITPEQARAELVRRRQAKGLQ